MSAPAAAAVFELERYTVLANHPRSLTQPGGEGGDELRRVGVFLVIDEHRRVVAQRDDDAPHLRPDFLIRGPGEGAPPLLEVRPQSGATGRLAIFDRSGPAPELLGALVPGPRRPWRARPYGLEDQAGRTVAQLHDSDGRQSFARRWRPRTTRERYALRPTGGGPPAFLLRDLAPVPYLLRVVTAPGFALDRRLLLVCALCVPALEGSTAYLRPR
jgi:hypothetical protein